MAEKKRKPCEATQLKLFVTLGPAPVNLAPVLCCFSLSPARRPAPTATPATPVASTNGENSHRRRVITKPPVPKQTPMEKKPPVPRAPRNARPINAPTPDLKNVRSKIGSTDNMKYQPGGGKVGAECPVEGSTKILCNPGTKMRLRIWIGSDYKALPVCLPGDQFLINPTGFIRRVPLDRLRT